MPTPPTCPICKKPILPGQLTREAMVHEPGRAAVAARMHAACGNHSRIQSCPTWPTPPPKTEE